MSFLDIPRILQETNNGAIATAQLLGLILIFALVAGIVFAIGMMQITSHPEEEGKETHEQ